MPRSKPALYLNLDGTWSAGVTEAAHDGGSWLCHGQQRWLARLRPCARYGSANSARFAPTGSQQDGDSILLTLKQRWAAVTSFAKTQPTVWGPSGSSPAWPRPWAASTQCPLASPDDELARAVVESCTWGLLGFVGLRSILVEIWVLALMKHRFHAPTCRVNV
jgi:hypothetical protein